jgi:hypothetical protein
MITSGLTKEEIISWSGEDVFNQGLALVMSGSVIDVKYDDENLVVSGKIQRDD